MSNNKALDEVYYCACWTAHAAWLMEIASDKLLSDSPVVEQ
ncbi:hypothetical protein O4N73_14450 [Vibrio parahaemolyticus]|nr:hypothetical protein [Vibrio parahaemolyticus]MCZ6370402.1 hypothetical protein [Vibrio parahaemolyticus]